jgi:hypothetical protein
MLKKNVDQFSIKNQHVVNRMICLNIGGEKFYTSVETLTQNHFFQCLVSKYGNKQCEFFVDRDGTHFRYILNYLRGGVVLPLDSIILHELRVEADYYGIPQMIEMIDKKLSTDPSVGLKSIPYYLKLIYERML